MDFPIEMFNFPPFSPELRTLWFSPVCLLPMLSDTQCRNLSFSTGKQTEVDHSIKPLLEGWSLLYDYLISGSGL